MMYMLNKLKIIVTGLCLVAFCITAQAQQVKKKSPEQIALELQYLDSLRKYEMELRTIGDSMIDGSSQLERAMSIKKFIPTLVKTLQFPGSIDYPFDSLTFMKKLKPGDGSFRLYNWMLRFDDGTFRYYGAVHMNNPDSFKLYPLRDYTSRLDTSKIKNMQLSTEEWMGALYYEIIETKHRKKKYYTLLGWNGNTSKSNMKLLEVMHFEGGRPVFGAPIFKVKDELLHRVIYEFRNDAVMALDFAPSNFIIILDHMVPPNEAAKGQYRVYVPDGTYDYFRLKKGKWVFYEMLFETYKKTIPEAGDYDDMLETAPKAKTKEEMQEKKPVP
ncbi:MAG: hypothetical protein M3Q97_07070 [Bacteroidota bacterium]|nr:hypothetical protein [Bacteroidota bacterium]